jgi:IrrE N-terminal-like domain
LLATEVRQALRVADGRLDPERCCAVAGIEVADASLGATGCEALLLPRAQGLRILINVDFGRPSDALLTRRRRRFRIAHEFGHAFFYSRRSGRPRRCLPPGGRAEERFCDEFARSLLAPPPTRYVDAAGVAALKTRYDVSLEVAARTTAASALAPRVGLWWWKPPVRGRRAVMLEQWASDGELTADLAISPYRTDPSSLTELFNAAQGRFGDAMTVAVFPKSRQALALIATS